MDRRLSLTVPPDRAGQRVDTLLRQLMGLSGTVIRRVKWLPDGILLDGQRVHTDVRARAGQTLSVLLSDPDRRSGIPAAPGELDVRYEDADLVVVNKSPGVLVHPIPGHWTDTLGNFLLHHYDRAGEGCDFHPVHRLDRGTSGLLVVTKHPHAQTVLKGQLHTPDFRRTYLALTLGPPEPAAGAVDAPLGKVPGSPIAQRVDPQGLPARTRYRTLAAWDDLALVELELDTGRTHQIRVHMAHLGHPLLGDFLYGREDPARIGRTALHSHRLAFRHPVTGETMTFTQPLPPDMAALCPTPPIYESGSRF